MACATNSSGWHVTAAGEARGRVSHIVTENTEMTRGIRLSATRSLRLRLVLTVAGVLGLSAGVAQAQDPVFDAKGFQQNRDYFSPEPFEHIDTGGGALVLTFTDLVLPGAHTGPIGLGGVALKGASRYFGKSVRTGDVGGLAQYEDRSLSVGAYGGVTLGSHRSPVFERKSTS